MKVTKEQMQESFSKICEKCCCKNSSYNKNGGVWCYNGFVGGDIDLCGYTLESAKKRLNQIERDGK